MLAVKILFFSPDLLDPVITSTWVTPTSAIIFLTQPIDSLPAEQYTVTLTRKPNFQHLCQNFESTITMTIYVDSVLFEDLEEFSVYSVNVRANTFDLEKSLQDPPNITTLTTGRCTGNV